MRANAAAARSKERHPDQFCATPRCLWRTGGGQCPRHPRAEPAAPPVVVGATGDSGSASGGAPAPACLGDRHEASKAQGLAAFLSENELIGVQRDEVETLVLANCRACRSTLGYAARTFEELCAADALAAKGGSR